MTATALPSLEPVSPAALEPVSAAASAAGSAEPTSAVAAAERVQQLQALVAVLERGPQAGGSAGSTTFASALDAAQAGAATGTATASPTATPTDTAYAPATTAGEGAYPSSPTAPASSLAPEASTYAPLIDQAAARYGVEPSLLAGLIQQESGFDPSARSGAGALGLTQLMPGTAASLGVAEPLDPAQSIEGGARYLAQQLAQFGGNTADALAAYNAGPGAVQQYGGVPPYAETQQYVADVLGNAAAFRQSGELGSVSPALSGASVQGAATAPTYTEVVPA